MILSAEVARVQKKRIEYSALTILLKTNGVNAFVMMDGSAPTV